MNGQVINELFQQIVHSEEKIKKRFEAIKRVNHEIQQHQEKIRHSKYEIEAVHGNLHIVNHQLLQEEIEGRWLEMRESILVDQKKDSCSTNAKLEEDINELATVATTERDQFIGECEQFLSEFHLKNFTNGVLNFEEIMLQEYKQLLQTHDEIQEKIHKFEERNERLTVLIEKKDSLCGTVEKLSKRKAGLEERLNNLRLERQKVATNKESVATKPNNCQEFQSLVAEVDARKETQQALQEEHKRLASELYQLHQRYMQVEHRQIRGHIHPNSHLQNNPWKVNREDATIPTIKRRRMFNYNASKKQKHVEETKQDENDVEETKQDENDVEDFFSNSEELPSLDWEVNLDEVPTNDIP